MDAGKGRPSTRTWDYAIRVYAVAVTLGYDTEDRLALLAGLLGNGAAGVPADCEDADLVDPEAWLTDPTSVAIDKIRIDRTVAGLTSVVHAVQTKLTDERWTSAWKIMAHVVAQDAMAGAMVGADLLVAMYRDLAKRDPAAIKALTPPHKLMSATPRAWPPCSPPPEQGPTLARPGTSTLDTIAKARWLATKKFPYLGLPCSPPRSSRPTWSRRWPSTPASACTSTRRTSASARPRASTPSSPAWCTRILHPTLRHETRGKAARVTDPARWNRCGDCELVQSIRAAGIKVGARISPGEDGVGR